MKPSEALRKGMGMVKGQSIKECIEDARKSIEERPDWMKQLSYFAYPSAQRLEDIGE